MSGLVSLQGSSGSTTAYATSGSGQMVFAQGERASFLSKTGVSGQSTNDQSSPSLSSSAASGTTYGVTTQAQGTSQFAPGSSSPYATISLPKYATSQLVTGPSSKQFTTVYGTKTGSSAPFTLQGSTTYGGPIQTQDASSQFVSGSSTPYVTVSLPQGVTSQSAVPSSKQITSVYSTQTGSSAPFTLQRLVQAQDATSQVVSASSPYVALSLPQDVTSQLTPLPSSKQITTVYSTETGSSTPFTLQGSTTYGGLLQAQDSTSQVSVSSTPYVAVSLPQGVTSQSAVPSSKQITSVYSTQTGSSAPFTLQRLVQAQDATSQVVSGSSTPYVAVSLPQGVTSQPAVPSSKQITSVYSTPTGSSALFTLQGLIQGQDSSRVIFGSSAPYVPVPQDVNSQLTSVPSSKQITSVYSTQTGSSAPFTLQRLVQAQDATSQVVSESSSPHVTVSLPQDVTSLSTTVPSSKKPITSVYGTPTGSSALFPLQGSVQRQDSNPVVSVSSPYVAVSLPQAFNSQSGGPSSKQITSVYSTQTGSSAPFTLQRLVQAQDATSQVVSGSSPYVALPLPQDVTSQLTPLPSSKQITTVYSTETGSSTPFTLQGSTTYGGLLQAQDSTSQVSVSSTPYVAVSLPQGVTSQSAVPSSKQITSVYSTQTGSSAPFTLQRLVQAQDATSQVVSASSPYVALSLPQDVTSQLTSLPSSKQITSVYGTQTGSSAPFTLQGSTTYGGLLQVQDTTSQVVSGSSPYVAVSFPQGVTSQSAVPSSMQVTSVYGTQTGSSAPFALQGLLQGQDSTSQDVSVSSPYVALSLPQSITGQSAVPSSKQITSVYGTQTGSSAPFRLQGPLQTKDSPSSVVKTLTSYFSKPSSSSTTLRRYNSK
ncbi:uncharacterized protein LOC130236447 [Danio aesculapii]|uniref:uncharacterized protein LOC130236447 n=1 Tax=Danio aesculapii TaxID=1142201 RepID=UPI0024BF75E4|nr:uncharacterized protein LOC130236447 [Danio aesculapii]